MTPKPNLNSRRLLIPFLVTLVGSLLLLSMLILPFASADEDYEDALLDEPDEYVVEEIDMTNEDVVNISLMEYVQIYSEAARQDIRRETCIATIVIIAIFALFAVFTVLMSLLKKPIGIIIFNALSLVAFWLTRFDFEDRGVIPSSLYDWGVASVLTYIIGVVVIIGAIWLFIVKRRAKKYIEVE